MSDITLSPIPYNGGTLSLTNQASHICHLAGNKFFALFGQSTPNYLFAATINVNDLHVASPVASVGVQRAMNTTALTRARCWKLSDTRVLALVNADLVVYEVQPNDDIVQKAATITAFHSTYLWGTEVASTSGIGPYLVGRYIKDNTIWFVQRTSTTSAITLFRIDYDPVGDTLTKTVMQTIQPSTTATHLWRYFIQPIPGTTQWVVYALGGNTAWSTSTITAYYIYDSNGTQVSAVTTGIPNTARLLVVFSATKIAALLQQNTFLYWNGSTWSTNAGYFAAAYTAGSSMLGAEAFDTNYFMLLSTSAAEIGGTTHGVRISRILDANLGQTGAGTSGNGLSYTTLNHYFDQPCPLPVDAAKTTFVLFGRASTTAFRMRVLYQA